MRINYINYTTTYTKFHEDLTESSADAAKEQIDSATGGQTDEVSTYRRISAS